MYNTSNFTSNSNYLFSPKDLLVYIDTLDITEKKDRNSKIVKAYKEGYSQHMIAKVLGISQPAVFGIIKRS